MKLSKVSVKGRTVEVEVTAAGMFQAEVNGQILQATTLSMLNQQLNKVPRQKIAIEFYRRDEMDKVIHGVVTGIHASNGNLLVKFDDGDVCQEYKHSSAHRYLKLNTKEVSQLKKMYGDLTSLQAKIDVFEKDHSFNAYEEAERLINAVEEE